MATPALRGDYADKLTDAIRFAEHHRTRARDIAREIKDRVRHELTLRYTAIEMQAPRLQHEIDVIADARTSADARWKVAVGNERWGDDLATMYAGIVTTRQNAYIIEQNREIINLLGQVRDALGTGSS